MAEEAGVVARFKYRVGGYVDIDGERIWVDGEGIEERLEAMEARNA